MSAPVELPAPDLDAGDVRRWQDTRAGQLPGWLVETTAGDRVLVDVGACWPTSGGMTRDRARALGLALIAATEPPHADRSPRQTTKPVRVFDPAGDPLLTVRCQPDHRPDESGAVLAIRAAGDGPLPWLLLTGPTPALPLADFEVAHWPIAHPALWSPQLRRDLAHLHDLTRKDPA